MKKHHHVSHGAEAPAKECVEAAIAARKKDSCRVLAKIASAKLDSADEPLFVALKACGLALNVPTTTLQLDDTFAYPCFDPRMLLHEVAKRGFIHKILGVPIAYAHKTLPEFWRKHRSLYPQHSLHSQENVDYDHLIPFYLHGDGGRTYKKNGILILSAYPALGEGTRANPVDLQPLPGRGVKRPHPDCHGNSSETPKFSAGINLRGRSLANRFLFTALKCEYYKDEHHRFDELIDIWAQKMKDLFETGFEFGGDTWKIAVLGLTGDAPFLREAGRHNRSFSNVRKSAASNRILKGVCWLCDAGRTNGPAYEDVNILTADWLGTVGPRNPLPWTSQSPLLEHLFMDQNDPASFYLPDTFHIYYFGVGKDFASSSLIYLAKTVFKKRNIDASIDAINGELQRYLALHKTERAHFGRKFSKELLGYKSGRHYPFGRWSKGADTSFVVKFVEWLVDETVASNGEWSSDFVILSIRDGCKAIGTFLRILFGSSFWFTPQGAKDAILSGLEFSRMFMRLASVCVVRKQSLYKVTPKVHMYSHILLRMLTEYRIDPSAVVNPLSSSTFQCEDFVGHVARMSRRCSAKVNGTRIIHRYLVAIEGAFRLEAA